MHKYIFIIFLNHYSKAESFKNCKVSLVKFMLMKNKIATPL